MLITGSVDVLRLMAFWIVLLFAHWLPSAHSLTYIVLDYEIWVVNITLSPHPEFYLTTTIVRNVFFKKKKKKKKKFVKQSSQENLCIFHWAFFFFFLFFFWCILSHIYICFLLYSIKSNILPKCCTSTSIVVVMFFAKWLSWNIYKWLNGLR